MFSFSTNCASELSHDKSFVSGNYFTLTLPCLRVWSHCWALLDVDSLLIKITDITVYLLCCVIPLINLSDPRLVSRSGTNFVFRVSGDLKTICRWIFIAGGRLSLKPLKFSLLLGHSLHCKLCSRNVCWAGNFKMVYPLSNIRRVTRNWGLMISKKSCWSSSNLVFHGLFKSSYPVVAGLNLPRYQ